MLDVSDCVGDDIFVGFVLGVKERMSKVVIVLPRVLLDFSPMMKV